MNTIERDKAIKHLEVLRQDARDEIKHRIEQRDRYSIQLAVSLGAIIAVAVYQPDVRRVIVLSAPLVSLYFIVLILYSYRVHNTLALYLRKKIEPALSYLCETPLDVEWETFYKGRLIPGIRRPFFLMIPWVVLFLSIGYLLYQETLTTVAKDVNFLIVLGVVSLAYFVMAGIITKHFWKDIE